MLLRTCRLRLLSISFTARAMLTPVKQSKLDGFVKGGHTGSSKEINTMSSKSSQTKRPRPDGTDVPPEAKKPKASGTYRAFPANAPEPNEVDDGNGTILVKLEKTLKKAPSISHNKGGTVVYWMRMKDLRLKDNMALSLASQTAQKFEKNLVILHVISPGDYKAHDRAAVRIDFVLRNLVAVQEELDTYNIPLAVRTIEARKTIPESVIGMCKDWSASHLFANLEYEIDELRRDIRICEIAQEDGTIETVFHHDYVLVPPGKVVTKERKPYSVFTPFHKNWSAIMSEDIAKYSKDYPLPAANPDSIRDDPVLGQLFQDRIPELVKGFELPSEEYSKLIRTLFPTGTAAAEEMLRRFMTTRARKGAFADSPLAPGSIEDGKNSRVAKYSADRNEPALDGGTRLSPFLAAGVLSIRACLRAILKESPNGHLPMSRDTGLGSYTQELCFRDFYQHVMVAWPRVCMGRNFLLKLEAVQWDDDANGEKLKAWEEGRTGYPLIDAGMRQMKQTGWMHNRVRMVTASFLVKDLLLNWKEGERIFSRYLIDGDLGSNNGGWQWSASTGTDPQPYFRIFNPFAQSEKFDPDGEYIRHFVPELKNVKGKAIHDPYKHLKISEFKATGYMKPMVDHATARKKAIVRFKNPGTTADE